MLESREGTVSRTEGVGLAFKWSREKSSIVIGEYREQDVLEEGL